MFGVCLPRQSAEMLEKYRDIQEELFSSYNLSYRVIDMAPHELGCQANRKYDIEAWMPGMKRYGEISSCSNCTDFQVWIINQFNRVTNLVIIRITSNYQVFFSYFTAAVQKIEYQISRYILTHC